MRNCNTTVTTPTGVFTFHETKATYCQAKVECARRGQILAPVTNWGDLDALLSVANDKDPKCKFHYGYNDYFVGLDVKVCGGEETRLFTNNQPWNDTEHGDLYRWAGSKTKDINVAAFNPYFRKLTIGENVLKNNGYKFRFICLKPNSTGAEPLKSATSGEKVFSHPNLSALLLLCCAALAAAVLAIVSLLVARKKKEKEFYDLKREIEVLKSQSC